VDSATTRQRPAKPQAHQEAQTAHHGPDRRGCRHSSQQIWRGGGAGSRTPANRGRRRAPEAAPVVKRRPRPPRDARAGEALAGADPARGWLDPASGSLNSVRRPASSSEKLEEEAGRWRVGARGERKGGCNGRPPLHTGGWWRQRPERRRKGRPWSGAGECSPIESPCWGRSGGEQGGAVF
jgi:hypothetical protein